MPTGTTTVDFGSPPGSHRASVVVTGQTAIASDSFVEAFIMAESTADHNEDEHSIAPIKLTCGAVVPGTGFSIFAVSEWQLAGLFSVRWVWV